MTTARTLRVLVSCSLFAVACGRPPAPPPPSADPSSLRKLGDAELTGYTGRYQSHVWAGIRFAKAPKGELRFRAPQTLEPAGSQQALAFGAPCPQLASPFGVTTAEPGTFVGDEDCLFLNVYAPHMSAAEAASARLPVMVWFHGGGNSVGHAAGYDGGHLAERERVVVVMANYRLGPFGWLRHAALREGSSPEDASGNFGTLDQLEALRWVQKHAAAFGGNPENVTIFGESAGGRDVIALLASPLARGLFQRAISESGNVRITDAEPAEAFVSDGGFTTSSNEALLRLLVADGGATDAAAARTKLAAMKPAELAAFLRKLSPQAFLAGYRSDRSEGIPDVPNVFGDGVVLPKEPLVSLFARPGAYNQVPTMLGTNRDESKTFMLSDPRYVKRFTPLYLRMRDPERYKAMARGMSLAWRVSGADAPARALASSGAQVFVYRFDWDEEPTLLGAELSVMLGAGHGFEIPFVFGHFDLGPRANVMFTDANRAGREQLAAAMMGYWAEFARNGQPGKGRQGKGKEWQPFGAASGTQRFMTFDTEAGGGVRMQSGTLDMQSVLATMERDPRLRTPKERCEVLGSVVNSSPLLTKEAYGTVAGGACKAFPLSDGR